VTFKLSWVFETSDAFPYSGFLLFKPETGLYPYFLQGYGYSSPQPLVETPEGVSPMVRIGVAIGHQPVVEAVLEFGRLDLAMGTWHADQQTEGVDASFFPELGMPGLKFSYAGVHRVASLYKGVLIPPH
jgi:hypothetical protein